MLTSFVLGMRKGSSALVPDVSIGNGLIAEGYGMSWILFLVISFLGRIPSCLTLGCALQLIVFRGGEGWIGWGCLLLGVALECPSWPVVVVVGVGRWGRLVGGEDLRATVHLGYVPSLGVILSLHLLDIVADIACDVVVVNLEKSGHAVGIGGLDYLHQDVLHVSCFLVFVVLLLEVLVEVCNLLWLHVENLAYLASFLQVAVDGVSTNGGQEATKVLEVFLYVLFRESVAKVSKFVQQVAPVGVCTHLR